MKSSILIILILLMSTMGFAQAPGYYNGTEKLKGEDLKSALNDIIQDHVDFSYSDAKYIMNYSDQDPENENNIILFYTRRSQSNSSWGSGGDNANREHVWAKSHGDFADIRPMDGDAFNLHPADASVNMARLHYDFDSVPRTGGTYIEEADAWVYGNRFIFEPADISKGRVARTIFYMATRYEGENGEMDLKVVDEVNTSANAEHGKLSTLLKWNKLFPPDDFERRRNDRVYESQRNRNPFIDNPEFADLIWGGENIHPISIGQMIMAPEYPQAGSTANISVHIESSISSERASAKLYWDTEYDGESNSVDMTNSDLTFSGNIDLSTMAAGSKVYFKVVAKASSAEQVLRGDYIIPRNNTLTEISAVQGTGSASPMLNQTVTVSGIVTANFDGAYYIQSSNSPYNGLCVYDMQRGKIGDSVVVTGKVVEYSNLTELSNISETYVYPGDGTATPLELSIGDINESHEGLLVKINDVSFTEGGTFIQYGEQKTFHLSDGTNSISVYNRYNSRLGGKILPAGTVDVIAVVSQYNSSYQLLINSLDFISYTGDTEAPQITGVNVLNKDRIQISFNESLNPASVADLNNFSIDGGLTITSASLFFNTNVILQVENMQAKDYVLTINGVTDIQNNKMENATFNFTSTVSSALDDVSASSVSVYPNPSKGQMSINSDNPMRQISLINLMGVNLGLIESNNETSMNLDFGSLESGIYFLIIDHQDGSKSKSRLVIN